MTKQNTNTSNKTKKLAHSSFLKTVEHVEQTLNNHSGEFNAKQLWKKHNPKLKWETFLGIVKYLEDKNRIITSDDGTITYIWNPKLIRKLRNRKSF